MRVKFRSTGAGLVLAVVIATLAGVPAAAASPDVVVSQVYGGGGNSGATFTNDFIELYNRGSAPVDLTGWSVQYASATGAAWQVTPLSGTLAPGSHYLVQEAAGAGGTTPLPTPDATGTIALSGTAGKVALVTAATALTCTTGCATGASVRDLVGYGSTASSFEGSAPAAGLSNTTAALRAAAGATDTDDNAADFTAGPPEPRSTASGPTGPPEPPVAARIHDIQGAAHLSPLAGKTVTGVPGIVTALAANGYYLQDPLPDANPATSEAIFVFTNAAPTVAVGNAVSVAGTITEFRPGGSTGTANLTTTEISGPTTTLVAATATVPAPTLIGTGGRVPPTKVIDAGTGNVETAGEFRPATDGIDFYESLESMRVRVNAAVAVGPTNSFGELPVLGDLGLRAAPRTVRGGILLRPDDGNPERIFLDDALGGVTTPVVSVGAVATGPAVGVLGYSFGNFKLELTAPVAFRASPLRPEITRPDLGNELSIGTFNVENLDPADPPEKFSRLGQIVVRSLRSPDILALEEVQDDNGPVNDGTVTAGKTYQQLIDAIRAAGGPVYSYRQIDPANLQDGGEPGGNIRVGFLFAAGRGVTFASAPAGDTTTPVGVTTGGPPHLTINPGRIAPADPAWADSRKPLAAEFVYRGRSVFVIANHFRSKGGDDPLFGKIQPPQQASEEGRVAQATLVRDFVRSILAADANAAVAVVGDLNDFEFSPSVLALIGTPLVDLPATLPLRERYTYVFDGNSQVLDHILVSRAAARSYAYDIVHVNAEFADQVSDHDPQLVRLRLG